MIRGETVLSGAKHPGTEIQIMRCPAGAYYLGFVDEEGTPYSRETEYMDLRTAKQIMNHLRK